MNPRNRRQIGPAMSKTEEKEMAYRDGVPMEISFYGYVANRGIS